MAEAAQLTQRAADLETVTSTLPALQAFQQQWNAYAQLQNEKENYIRVAKKDYSSVTVFLLIGGGLLCLFFGILVTQALQSAGADVSDLLPVIFAAVPVGIIFFLRSKGESKVGHAKIAEYDSRLAAAENQLMQYYSENEQIFNRLPRDYCYYDAAAFFEHALANGRADSLKEAINLYEEHIHRLNMENANQQILQSVQYQAQMLQSIDASARSAAISSALNLLR